MNNSNEQKPITHLSIMGGGAKGAVALGSLMALSDQQRQDIKVVSGTSVGSLLGVAFACGLTPQELAPILRKLTGISQDFKLSTKTQIQQQNQNNLKGFLSETLNSHLIKKLDALDFQHSNTAGNSSEDKKCMASIKDKLRGKKLDNITFAELNFLAKQYPSAGFKQFRCFVTVKSKGKIPAWFKVLITGLCFIIKKTIKTVFLMSMMAFSFGSPIAALFVAHTFLLPTVSLPLFALSTLGGLFTVSTLTTLLFGSERMSIFVKLIFLIMEMPVNIIDQLLSIIDRKLTKAFAVQLLSYENSPDVSIVDAVTASTALPPVFPNVKLTWNGEEFECYDGGFANNTGIAYQQYGRVEAQPPKQTLTLGYAWQNFNQLDPDAVKLEKKKKLSDRIKQPLKISHGAKSQAWANSLIERCGVPIITAYRGNHWFGSFKASRTKSAETLIKNGYKNTIVLGYAQGIKAKNFAEAADPIREAIMMRNGYWATKKHLQQDQVYHEADHNTHKNATAILKQTMTLLTTCEAVAPKSVQHLFTHDLTTLSDIQVESNSQQTITDIEKQFGRELSLASPLHFCFRLAQDIVNDKLSATQETYFNFNVLQQMPSHGDISSRDKNYALHQQIARNLQLHLTDICKSEDVVTEENIMLKYQNQIRPKHALATQFNDKTQTLTINHDNHVHQQPQEQNTYGNGRGG